MRGFISRYQYLLKIICIALIYILALLSILLEHDLNIFETNFEFYVDSDIFEQLLLVNIFVSIPIVINLALSWKAKPRILHRTANILIFLSLILPSTILYSLLHTDQLTVSTIVPILVAKFSGIVGSVLCSVSLKPDELSIPSIRVYKINSTLAMIFLLTSEVFMVASEVGSKTVFGILSFACFCISLVLLAFTLVRVIREMVLSRDEYTLKERTNLWKLRAIFVFIVFDTISHFIPQYGELGSCLCQIVLAYFLTVLPIETYKVQTLISKQKLLERLDLIRYISHEMRTPLNSAILGLSMVGEATAQLVRSFKISARVLNSGCNNSCCPSSPSNSGSEKFPPTQQHSQHQLNQQVHASGRASCCMDQLSGVLGSFQKKSAIEDIQSTVRQVRESCGVAISTLDDILTFDKMDDQKLSIECRDFNPWRFLRRAANPFQMNAKDSNVKLEINCVEADTKWFFKQYIRGDQFKLSQVVRNLISNAIKFTTSGGTVTVKLEKLPVSETSIFLEPLIDQGVELNGVSNQMLRITVTDSGAGISPENQRKLFGKYVQFDASKLQKGGGSGLGLWITKRIVQMHGGHISVESKGEGHGTSFFVDLPLFFAKGDLASNYSFSSSNDRSDPSSISASPFRNKFIKPEQQSKRSVAGGSFYTFSRLESVPSEKSNSWSPAEPSFSEINLETGEETEKMTPDSPKNILPPVRSPIGRTRNYMSTEKAPSPDSSSLLYIKQQMNISPVKISPVSSEKDDVNEAKEEQAMDAPLSGDNQVKVKPKTHHARFVEPQQEEDNSLQRIRQLEMEMKNTDQLLRQWEQRDTTSPRSHKTWDVGLKVMVVDDSVSNRKLTGMCLQRKGHSVVLAADGLECVELFSKHLDDNAQHSAIQGEQTGVNAYMDLVLIDDNMPRMGGVEATKNLRMLGFTGLIYAVTGDVDETKEKLFLDSGANGVFVKPLDIRLLQKVVKKALEEVE